LATNFHNTIAIRANIHAITLRPKHERSAIMNRRLFLAAAPFSILVSALAGRGNAARLPLSTLTVQVLSVDQESFSRTPTMTSYGEPVGGMWFETTHFVAKAQIQKVLQTDHDLTAGRVIEIRYTVRVRTPRALPGSNPSLKAGETVTVTVSGGGDRYAWRS
jgi:hypothetical protein